MSDNLGFDLEVPVPSQLSLCFSGLEVTVLSQLSLFYHCNG